MSNCVLYTQVVYAINLACICLGARMCAQECRVASFAVCRPAQCTAVLSAAMRKRNIIRALHRELVERPSHSEASCGADHAAPSVTGGWPRRCRHAQVARVEQMESAAEAKAARGAKATIRREMTRVHTPAIATDNIGADAVRRHASVTPCYMFWCF